MSTEQGEYVFRSWAPESSGWSLWAKPAPFALLDQARAWGSWHATPDQPEPAVPLPPVELRTDQAWIVDLDGALAVRFGLALALAGWRPVPLFNGIPDPEEIVPTIPVLKALVEHRPALSALRLPADAPPAFLLDHRRMRPTRPTRVPGAFDNRWQLTPQDLPSAARLQQAGITTVMLLASTIGDDLAHALLRWQQAGLRIERTDPDSGITQPTTVYPPPWYRSWWWRFLVTLGLRAHAGGGFGARVPEPSSGGG